MQKVVVYLLECTIDILTWKALDRHQGSPQTRKFGILKRDQKHCKLNVQFSSLFVGHEMKLASIHIWTGAQAALSESNQCGGRALSSAKTEAEMAEECHCLSFVIALGVFPRIRCSSIFKATCLWKGCSSAQNIDNSMTCLRVL